MAVTAAVSDASIGEAAEVIQEGGHIIYPTETCYGLGCDALDTDAVEQVYDIKQRPQEKKLTVIVDSLETAEEYCRLSPTERRVAAEFMPGPLTLLAEKRERVPDLLNSEFAFRVPGNRTARRLAAEADVPVVATSANVSGEPAAYRPEDIDPRLRTAADMLLDGGALEQRPSSTVIGLTEGDVIVHREGPVTKDDVEAVIGGG